MAHMRVLRVIEIVGPEDWVKTQVARSIHGEWDLGRGRIIRGATVDTFYPPAPLVKVPGQGRGNYEGDYEQGGANDYFNDLQTCLQALKRIADSDPGPAYHIAKAALEQIVTGR